MLSRKATKAVKKVWSYEKFIEGYKDWKREKENSSDNTDKKYK